MDEQATFEPQAVLAPRRTGWIRLAVVVPVLVLVAIVWAGLDGARSNRGSAHATSAVAIAATANPSGSTSVALPRAPGYPTQVLGINVHRLDEVQAERLGRDAPIAIAGWYVTTAITNCPPLAATYRSGAPPDFDTWAFCDRAGVLYASQPAADGRMPTDDLDNNQPRALGLPAVAVTVTIGVREPQQIQPIGADATPVVIVGHFVPSGGGGPWCGARGCEELVVDYLPWAADL